MGEEKTQPACPACSTLMVLASVVPRVAGLPELRSYRCPKCSQVLTKPADEKR